jgi:transcriptional regulator with XRE-family HTH domain
MTVEDLSELFDHAITVAGKTNKGIARELGVSHDTVSKWRNRRGHGIEHARLFFRALDLCGYDVKVRRRPPSALADDSA